MKIIHRLVMVKNSVFCEVEIQNMYLYEHKLDKTSVFKALFTHVSKK